MEFELNTKLVQRPLAKPWPIHIVSVQYSVLEFLRLCQFAEKRVRCNYAKFKYENKELMNLRQRIFRKETKKAGNQIKFLLEAWLFSFP